MVLPARLWTLHTPYRSAPRSTAGTTESEPDDLSSHHRFPAQAASREGVLADDSELAHVIDKKGRNVVIADKEDIQRKVARPAEKLVLAFLKGYAGLLKKGETLLRKPPGFLDRNFQAPVISR